MEFSAPPPSAVPASLEELADPVVLDEVREWLRRDDAAAKVSASKRLSVVVCAQIWNTFFRYGYIYTKFSIPILIPFPEQGSALSPGNARRGKAPYIDTPISQPVKDWWGKAPLSPGKARLGNVPKTLSLNRSRTGGQGPFLSPEQGSAWQCHSLPVTQGVTAPPDTFPLSPAPRRLCQRVSKRSVRPTIFVRMIVR